MPKTWSTGWQDGGSAKAIVERGPHRFRIGRAAGFVDDVIAANADSVAAFHGKENALKFLIGQVMKASRGKANPQLAEQLLREKLTAS